MVDRGAEEEGIRLENSESNVSCHTAVAVLVGSTEVEMFGVVVSNSPPGLNGAGLAIGLYGDADVCHGC